MAALDDNQLKREEYRKRRREIFIAILIGVVFCALIWVQYHLVNISRELPFEHSVFFFGLVNFNIILVLFLLFLIFRNVVKVFVERQGRVIGSSLRAKLVAAFAAFSFVPTTLMFIISVVYINSSFEKWFSAKMADVMRDALEVTKSYIISEKNRNYHYAYQISEALHGTSDRQVRRVLSKYIRVFQLDAVEFYTDLFKDPILVVDEKENLPKIPILSLDKLRKGLEDHVEDSTVHKYDYGNLVRVVVPVKRNGNVIGALVVNSFVPLSLISQMDEIASAYGEIRDVNPLEYPVKSIYLIILILMTLVILFAATWLGFHLARQLATPLQKLGEAIRKVAKGSYQKVELETGSEEIGNLIMSFNQMTQDLAQSQDEASQANESLKTTLSTLDEHTRYIEVVLSNVSAGVVSVDSEGTITTMNRRAGNLLKVVPKSLIGKKIEKVLPSDHLKTFRGLKSILINSGTNSLSREIRLNIGENSMLMQMSIATLKDEVGRDLGLVIVFDDMTPLVNAQRAAAWRDVAKRIAHEIKNPLTPIKLSAQRLDKKFGDEISDPAFRACTSTIIKQVDGLKGLVNEFSQFARLPQSQPRVTSLNNLVGESLVLYQTGHKDIDFQFTPDENLPDISFDLEQMRRVISNLLENSVAAVTGREFPRVEIKTLFERELQVAKLIVQDNGPGIPDEIRSRVFEPYVTTKDSGTGLGLSIVKKLVEEPHGSVRALKPDSQGTQMIVELPVLVAQISNEHELVTKKTDEDMSEE